MRDIIASGNIEVTLSLTAAEDCLDIVLGAGTTMLGLQEFGNQRNRLLTKRGRLFKGPFPRLTLKRRQPKGRYTWARPRLGLGGPVGVLTNDWELLGCHPVVLHRPGRVEGTASTGRKRKAFLPASIATVSRWRNRHTGKIRVLINFHLTANVDDGGPHLEHGKYRTNLPLRVRRHRKERRALEKIVARHLKHGHEVAAVGDSNFDRMPIKGLTGWWDAPATSLPAGGTLGWRDIDCVSVSWGKPESVEILKSKSDHNHPIVTETQ